MIVSIRLATSTYLAMEKGSNGEVPRRLGGHDNAQEWPDPVVVERRDEHYLEQHATTNRLGSLLAKAAHFALSV